MTKEEIFDLMIKGFGIYFLVLAIIALPGVIKGILVFASYLPALPWDFSGTDEGMEEILRTIKVTSFTQTLGYIIKLVIYIVASINFLRTGSWVKRLMRKNK